MRGITALVLLAVATSGCIGDGPAPLPTTPGSPTPTSPMPTSPTPDDSVKVEIIGFTFSPAELRISPGTKVSFRNEDTAAHTATSTDGAFDSGILRSEERYEFTFGTAGTFDYFCEVHPDMKGTVVVSADAASTAPPAPSAKGDVYMLDFKFSPASITVTQGDTVVWANHGREPHGVLDMEHDIRGDVIGTNEIFEFTFEEAGTYDYVCVVHPPMKGRVVVEPREEPATTPTPEPTPEPTPTTPSPTQPPPDKAVSIQGFAFSPKTLEVPAGTKVTWTNGDSARHTATANGGAFDSGDLEQGDAYSFTFTTAGTFSYLCARHPSMTGTVVVT